MMMKYLKGISLVGLVLMMSAYQGVEAPAEGAIQWISFEEAAKRVQEPGNTKKVFIDVYTDWCGWCKVMDKKTFNHPEVAKYMTEKFHMVKLDAEQKEDIEFKGTTFKFVPSGRNGYHELAASLLQGELSYPTVLFMDEELRLITKVPGFQPASNFYAIAQYFGEDHYISQKWEDFQATYKAPF